MAAAPPKIEFLPHLSGIFPPGQIGNRVISGRGTKLILDLGQLIVEPRSPGLKLRGSDRAVLPQIAGFLHALT
jgi:hypothetical protein